MPYIPPIQHWSLLDEDRNRTSTIDVPKDNNKNEIIKEQPKEKISLLKRILKFIIG